MTNIESKLIKPKLGVLELAKQLGSVSAACKTMGYSRDSFYRFKKLYENGGEEALREISRKKPIIRNRVPEHVERAVIELAIENPALGQLRVSQELLQRGIVVSSGGVRSIRLRNELETMKKRLKALEKAKSKREAAGEIETHHPGYPGSQDTYFVGTMKGVGRIYQQTFVDTYSRVAMAKLYIEKTAITAADMLNDQVVPFFDGQGVPLLRILTDRGTEYCGTVERHSYQLDLAMEGIDHSKTKANHPQTNGICERFHRSMKNEFYDIAFRKKIYASLEQLQTDVDQWLAKYNEQRPHSGKHCYGKTPMQTFREARHLVGEKTIPITNQSDSMYDMARAG